MFCLFSIKDYGDKIKLEWRCFVMKYMVGLKNGDQELLRCIKENKENIYEVYFSWGDIPNGRTSQVTSEAYAPWEMQEMQRQALKELSDAGVSLNLLFNANCYGKDSQSRAFFHKVGTVIDYVSEYYGLQSITTTSPLIAKFVHQNFENIEVRASVNMEIGTIQGMDYLAEYFDSYYMKREFLKEDINKLWQKKIAPIQKWLTMLFTEVVAQKCKWISWMWQ